MRSTVDPSAAETVVARLASGDARSAREKGAELVRHTPVLSSRSLSELCGGRVLLKAENLQRTGSFKIRGAMHKLWGLDNPRGVVAGSAGNHAQSLAYAARASNLPCEVFMPREAAIAKIAAVEALSLIH